jgi:ribosomal protein S4E
MSKRDLYIKAKRESDVTLEINGVSEGTFAAGSTIELNLTDGTNPVTPDDVTVVGNVVTVDLPKPLELLVPYSTSDTTATFTVVTGSDGTITSAVTTGLTSVTYEVNATPETIPFILAVGDVVTIDFDAAGSDGLIKLIGNYA